MTQTAHATRPDAAVPPGSERLLLTNRGNCPSCGSTKQQPLWTGHFSDPKVMQFLAQFHYSADLSSALPTQPFALVACGDCSLHYHRHVLSGDSIARFYSNWTDAAQVSRFEAEHGRADPFTIGLYRTKLILRLRKLLQRKFDDPLRLLDFGCGDGMTLAQARMFGFDSIGIDLSQSRLQRAQRHNAPVFADLRSFDRDGGGKVHAIILEQVLEHLVDPRDTIEMLQERLLPGGVLYVAVPNCAGITEPKDFHSFHHLHPLEHVNAFTPDSLRTLIESTGFQRLRWPAVFASSGVAGALRSVAGMMARRQNTEQFFRYPG